jgi:hypothetical protein
MAASTEQETRRIFQELQPGDRVEIVHEVKVGMQVWPTTTRGTVIRTERRRHGLHFRRHLDDKVYSDLVLLKRDDGELTTATLDEFTVLRRID